MVVVEIDDVGAEPLERGVERAAHEVARAAREVAVTAHGMAELRRQHDLLAAALEELPEEAFAAALVPVHVGGVEVA